jgi:hypothetical protein
MKRALTLTALALTACGAAEPTGPAAPSTSADAGAAAAPKVEQQRIQNLGYFDVATLFPAPPVVAGHATSEALLGVEVTARPVVMECLVDPRNRGPEQKTHVVVDAALADAGVTHQVTGQNLTPAGTACIEGALRTWTQGVPALTAKNVAARDAGSAVKSHLEYDHVVGVSPAVVLGVNEASDIAGAIRLALPTWSDCFTAWKSAPPRLLRATVGAVRPKPVTPTVTLITVAFDPTTDAAAGAVAACLTGKLKAIPVKTPAGESLTMPYVFRLVHSGIGDPLPDAPPELQFVQLDLQRARRTAETAIVLGERGHAVAVYDDLVKRFKAKAAPEVTVEQLREKCAVMVTLDDKLIAAAERQAAVEEATHRFTVEQKARDASWAEAEAGSTKNLADAQKDLESFKANKKLDEGACPKVKY